MVSLGRFCSWVRVVWGRPQVLWEWVRLVAGQALADECWTAVQEQLLATQPWQDMGRVTPPSRLVQAHSGEALGSGEDSATLVRVKFTPPGRDCGADKRLRLADRFGLARLAPRS